MATVFEHYCGQDYFLLYLQQKIDSAKSQKFETHQAILLLQRVLRGYLTRKHIKKLAKSAITIQCVFRRHQARKVYRKALYEAVRVQCQERYARAALKIQVAWRGYWSRKTRFDFKGYRRWLTTVAQKSKQKAAEVAEFRQRSGADSLKLLEDNARQWLAVVVFKLHHLIRTFHIAGIYSISESHELSEFEKLLNSIHYKEYMIKLKNKYDEYVRKKRHLFSNKKLFPVIGDGSEYWYLSLPEIYKLSVVQNPQDTRHCTLHHGSIHEKPFLWKKIERPKPEERRGPFLPPKIEKQKITSTTCKEAGDTVPNDPRFHLYLQHYTPQPNLFKYIDLQVNALISRKVSIDKVNDPHWNK